MISNNQLCILTKTTTTEMQSRWGQYGAWRSTSLPNAQDFDRQNINNDMNLIQPHSTCADVVCKYKTRQIGNLREYTMVSIASYVRKLFHHSTIASFYDMTCYE